LTILLCDVTQFSRPGREKRCGRLWQGLPLLDEMHPFARFHVHMSSSQVTAAITCRISVDVPGRVQQVRGHEVQAVRDPADLGRPRSFVPLLLGVEVGGGAGEAAGGGGEVRHGRACRRAGGVVLAAGRRRR
jgi:hypothetical protein